MRRDFSICAGLVVLTLAAYWQVGAFDFIGYDDNQYVYDNLHVRKGLSWENVGWAFTTGRASNWHPLTWLSHMLDVQLFGLRSGAHHAVNLAFHVANTLLLFLILRRMTAAVWQSAMVAALFALHPLHVESVAWVAERKDVLSTFLGLLTIAAYVRYTRNPGRGRYFLVAVLFALGLMVKPMLVTLPFVFLLLDYWPLGRMSLSLAEQSTSTEQPSKTAWKSRKQRGNSQSRSVGESQKILPIMGRLVLEKLPLLMLSVLSCVVTYIVQQGAMVSIEHVSFGPRIANALLAYVHYLGKMVWPLNLALPYPFKFSPDAGHILLSIALLVSITSAAIWAWRSCRPYLTVGWFWYLGTLVPVIGIVQVGSQGMADRYTYIPSIGIFIMAVWGLTELIATWDRRHLALPMIGLPVLAACFMLTRVQIQYWRNTETLFLHTNDVIPGSKTVHKILMMWYWEQEKPAESIAQAEEVLKLDPQNAEAHTHIALILIEQKRWDEAAAHLKIALQSNPSFAAAYNHYGVVLFAKEDAEGAIKHLREAVRLEPENVCARQNLAKTYFAIGKLEEAAQQWRKVLHLQPHSAEAAGELGVVLQKQGKTTEAIDFYRQSLESYPRDVNVRNNLAVALLTTGKTKEALDQWRELLHLQPNDVVTLNALAWIQATAGDQSLRNGKEAVQLAEKALQLSKEQSPEMLDTLAAAYAEVGRYSEAVATASKAFDMASSAGQSDLAGKIRARLQYYQSDRPYRELPDR